MIIRFDGKTVEIERSGNGFGRCISSIRCICVRLRCILCAALRLAGSRRFVPDSLLEGSGFEPEVSLRWRSPDVTVKIDGAPADSDGFALIAERCIR
jgi:hypothetical protein